MAYRPRGVVGVVSPWNFPLAIPCGMTAGALAAGNAVVLKPAEQSPGCALALAQALLESGLPAAALGLVPGDGEAGAALVDDPRVHAIAFTGSAAVGLEIIRRAADTPGGPAAPQARGGRDGRQELRDRGRGCGPRRGGAGDRVVGLRVRGPEVLGCVAGAGPRGRRRAAARAPARGDRPPGGRPGLRADHRGAAGDRGGGTRPGDVLRRGRGHQDAGPLRPGRGLVLPAHAGLGPARRRPRAGGGGLRADAVPGGGGVGGGGVPEAWIRCPSP